MIRNIPRSYAYSKFAIFVNKYHFASRNVVICVWENVRERKQTLYSSGRLRVHRWERLTACS